MMFVGDKGKILAGFNIEDPRHPSRKEDARLSGPEAAVPARERDPLAGPNEFMAACRGLSLRRRISRHAGPISEAFNLAGGLAARRPADRV